MATAYTAVKSRYQTYLLARGGCRQLFRLPAAQPDHPPVSNCPLLQQQTKLSPTLLPRLTPPTCPYPTERTHPPGPTPFITLMEWEIEEGVGDTLVVL